MTLTKVVKINSGIEERVAGYTYLCLCFLLIVLLDFIAEHLPLLDRAMFSGHFLLALFSQFLVRDQWEQVLHTFGCVKHLLVLKHHLLEERFYHLHRPPGDTQSSVIICKEFKATFPSASISTFHLKIGSNFKYCTCNKYYTELL